MDAEPTSGEKATIPAPMEQNISALMRRRAQEMKAAGAPERLAAGVTAFLGSMWSIVAHVLVFGGWAIANIGLVPGVTPWDPTFVVLGMIASVEAIFLTTFVLINQNRLARMDEDRSELALQIGLLTEQETSKLIALALQIADRLEVPVPDAQAVEHLATETRPDAVLDEIRRRKPSQLGSG